jgi:hypothetical protein
VKHFINAVAPWWRTIGVLSGCAVGAGFASGDWLLAGGGLICMAAAAVLGIMVAVEEASND